MLKPKQRHAIEILVAGTSDDQAAQTVGCHRCTIGRWKDDPEFAAELFSRTQQACENTRRVVGAQARASAATAMYATNRLQAILENPGKSSWLELQAVQTAMKHGRHAADKFDKDFNKLETVGKLSPERQHIADSVVRQIVVWEDRDRHLARLQEYEQRRMQQRREQRDAEMLRRLNIVARHGPEERAYLYGVWRREDDADEELEAIRRDKARQEFAAAAEVELKELPPQAPFKWADVSGQFENFVQSSQAPATEEELHAEIQRVRSLEYIDPNSPEGKAQQEKFDAELKANEAEYRANVMPKVPPSPIEREDRGMGVSPMSNGKSPCNAGSSTDTHGPEAHATNAKKWTAPIPDQDSPEREAYLASLGDDEVPQLSEADRQRRADWECRRKRSEENEKQPRKKDCA